MSNWESFFAFLSMVQYELPMRYNYWYCCSPRRLCI